MANIEQIRNALYLVVDPEIRLDIVNLGLIYDIKIENNKAFIKMTLTSPACPFGPQIIEQVKKVVNEIEGIIETEVEIVWSPPWNLDMLTEDAKDKLGIY